MLSVRGPRLGLREPSCSAMGRRARLQMRWRRCALPRAATRATMNLHRGRRKVLEPNSTKRAGVIEARKRMAPALRRSDSAPPRPPLVTLEDAAKYIQKLPKAEQQLLEWQAAVEAMLIVVEHNGPTMMARIGVMRALNRHVERVFNPDRKDT